ncbi:MAG: branched-chain amino acid ABC transporter permease [Sulfolobales archaeon]
MDNVLGVFSIFIADSITFFSIYLMLNLSLNIERGLAGIPNFGLLLSYAAGAYITGSLGGRIAMFLTGTHLNIDPIENSADVISAVNPLLEHSAGLSIVYMLIMLSISAGFGALIGLIQLGPVIRLREDYLAITLLALAEILNEIGRVYKPMLNGPMGVSVPDPFSWAGRDLRFYVASSEIFLIALLIFIYTEYLSRSPLGRVFRAIRENEIAAASLGKSIVRYRAIAMILGSAIAGLSGSLFTLYQGSITPTLTRFQWTFLPWLMLFLGGIGNNIGVLIGTLIYVFINRIIIMNKHYLAAILPFDIVWFDYISLGIVMALILIYRPQGILPEKPYIPSRVRRIIQELTKES